MLLLLPGAFSRLMAQDTIDKYCLLIQETPVKAVGEQNTFKLFLGYDNSLMALKDTTLLAQTKLVGKRTSLIDAFNYLASLGWQYVGLTATMPSRTLSTPGQQYLFKRTFNRSALK